MIHDGHKNLIQQRKDTLLSVLGLEKSKFDSISITLSAQFTRIILRNHVFGSTQNKKDDSIFPGILHKIVKYWMSNLYPWTCNQKYYATFIKNSPQVMIYEYIYISQRSNSQETLLYDKTATRIYSGIDTNIDKCNLMRRTLNSFGSSVYDMNTINNAEENFRIPNDQEFISDTKIHCDNRYKNGNSLYIRSHHYSKIINQYDYNNSLPNYPKATNSINIEYNMGEIYNIPSLDSDHEYMFQRVNNNRSVKNTTDTKNEYHTVNAVSTYDKDMYVQWLDNVIREIFKANGMVFKYTNDFNTINLLCNFVAYVDLNSAIHIHNNYDFMTVMKPKIILAMTQNPVPAITIFYSIVMQPTRKISTTTGI